MTATHKITFFHAALKECNYYFYNVNKIRNFLQLATVLDVSVTYIDLTSDETVK